MVYGCMVYGVLVYECMAVPIKLLVHMIISREL
jgi:hypothetical protein